MESDLGNTLFKNNLKPMGGGGEILRFIAAPFVTRIYTRRQASDYLRSSHSYVLHTTRCTLTPALAFPLLSCNKNSRLSIDGMSCLCPSAILCLSAPVLTNKPKKNNAKDVM